MTVADDIRREVLRLFQDNPGDFISGAEISQRLGVSRTAVWKHIGQLRDAGYDIEAVTSRGYRLRTSPDVLLAAQIQAGLETRFVGHAMNCLAVTDSTNLRALELAEQGAADGTVVIAEEQTEGKGRLGRAWSSPGGVNLYASLVLRPEIAPYTAPQLTFLAALAVVEAIDEVAGLGAAVKWPNDVLLHGSKVAGILSEMRAESDRVHYVILGVGVNLNMTAGQFPETLRYPATSLLIEGGRQVSRCDFVRAFLESFERFYERFLYEGFDTLRPEWDALCDSLGRRVRVEQDQRPLVGVVAGLGEDGALKLRDDEGCIHTIYAGDVLPVDEDTPRGN